MAYDVNKEKGKKTQYGDENPYDALTSATQPTGGQTGSIARPAQTGPTTVGAAANPYSVQGLPGGDSGPSATGFVNFDRMYNANAGVSERESGKRADAAQAAAQKAQAGLTGAQQSFQSGLTGAQNKGPSAEDYQYATGQKQFWAPKDIPQAQGAGRVAEARQGDNARMIPGMTEDQFKSHLNYGANAGYGGPKSLSASQGYEDLLKQTIAAQDLAKNPLVGLNSTDAALLGAAGRPRLSELGDKYGHLADDLEAANKASVGQADAARDATKEGQGQYERLLQDYEAAHPQAGTDATGADGAAPGASKVSGYDSFEDFLNNPGWSENLHEGGMALSPADWATRGLGELGYSGPNASEAFGGAVAGGAAPKEDWAKANVHTALQQVMNEYGRDAAKYLFDHMTQEQWDAYLAGGNAGNIARMMRAWLESAGYSKQAAAPQSEVQQAGATRGEASAGTTDEQETARTNAYRNGWGEEWDRQFREGNKDPKEPGT